MGGCDPTKEGLMPGDWSDSTALPHDGGESDLESYDNSRLAQNRNVGLENLGRHYAALPEIWLEAVVFGLTCKGEGKALGIN